MNKFQERSLALLTCLNSFFLSGLFLGLIPVTDFSSDSLIFCLGFVLLGFSLVILWLFFVQPYLQKISEAQKDLEDYNRRNP